MKRPACKSMNGIVRGDRSLRRYLLCPCKLACQLEIIPQMLGVNWNASHTDDE